MKLRAFFVTGLVCLLFSGCNVPAVPVTSPSAVTTASGFAADIQTAADAIFANGGGTVYLPEGDFNLDSSVIIRDNVSLIGAGIGLTVLRTHDPSIVIEARGNNVRLSGFSLISVNYDGKWGIKVNNSIDFRVDHIYVEGYYHAGITAGGINIRGVIDHCEVKVSTIDLASSLGYGVSVGRDDYWQEDMELGSGNAVFIEDNVFINARHAVAANSGAHYVFRHNLVGQGVISHQADAHGVGHGSTEGTRSVEIYNNVISNPVGGDEAACGIRGGGGVIFNNIIRGYKYAVLLMVESDQVGLPYPVYHQVHDLWIWNNSHDGTGSEVVVASSPYSKDHIQENRDYFRYAKPGYTPYTYPHPLVLSNSS